MLENVCKFDEEEEKCPVSLSQSVENNKEEERYKTR
jgi:hypothetical protein